MQSIGSVCRLRLEALEAREVPATFVSPFQVTYQDFDGDHVTVTLSKPLLNPDNVAGVFQFDVGTVDGDNTIKQQLRHINVSGFDLDLAAGVSITVTATRSPVNGGDGRAAVGRIEAGAVNLGVVTVDGDLGQLDGGDVATPGLRGLAVHSLGRYGLATGAVQQAVTVHGPVDFIRVGTDVTGVGIQVFAEPIGRIGSVYVGGSLIGGAEELSGGISAWGNIGPVTIGGDLVGGPGIGSGAISAEGRMGGVTVGGSIIGGDGLASARISAIASVGPVRIGGEVIGGTGEQSGSVFSSAGVWIGGSVRGGAGDGSGFVSGTAVTVRGDLAGGAGPASGQVFGGPFGVTVRGSVLGGTGDQSGLISSWARLGLVRIGVDLVGGSGFASGAVSSGGNLAGVTIGGSVRGGAISSGGHMGPVVIDGDLIGTGDGTGRVESSGRLAAITVGGSVVGGAEGSGHISAAAGMGPVVIGGDLVGGAGNLSGTVYNPFSRVAQVTIGGSVRGGTGWGSGSVMVGPVAAIHIGGDLIGGSASGTADLTDSGTISAQRIGRLTIGASLIAGTDDTTGLFRDNGAVRVFDDIGTIRIRGNILGNSTGPAVISARGKARPTATSDMAIGSLTVLGRVEYALIQAGVAVDVWSNPNPDAQIGEVFVGGDWIASSIAAGAEPGPNGYFGDADDTRMTDPDADDPLVFSRIARLIIGGQVLGTFGGTDHYGIVAEIVGFVTVGGTRIPTTPAKDEISLGITGDFQVKEI